MPSFYSVVRLLNKKVDEPPYIKVGEFLYRFKTEKKETYLVLVEEYVNQLFVVKFYLKAHQHSKNKYKELICKLDSCQEHKKDSVPRNSRKIIFTCMEVCRQLSEQYPLHSFAFIGCPKLGTDETYENNQRFRIYGKIALTFVSNDNFRHYEDKKYSVFILINQANLKENVNLFNLYQSMYMKHIVGFLE